MLTNEQKMNLAEKAMKSLKNYILTEKKAIKDKPHFLWGGYKSNPHADLYISMKHGWVGAKDEKYRLSIDDYQDGKHIIEADTRSDLESIIRVLFGLLNQQKKVKGWQTLMVARDKAEFGSGWSREYVEFPSKVILCDSPCKEYKALQTYLNKYGNANLGNFQLFHSEMGGKRGYLWDEYGERIYLDNNPKRCESFLAELRKNRGTKDTMTCKYGRENWIDPNEAAHSSRWETECVGEKREYLVVTIKTPGGKVKGEIRMF